MPEVIEVSDDGLGKPIEGENFDLYVTTHLAQCIVLWHRRLGMKAQRMFVQGLRALKQSLSKSRDDTFYWGTACSGTDVMHHVCRHLSSHWQHCYDQSIEFQGAFCCERDSQKRGFLSSQFSPEVMFADAHELKHTKAVNLASGEPCIIPYVNGFAFGFSCTGRSPANRRASHNVNCIQPKRMDVSTSNTYEAGVAFIERARPDIVIMENVKELDQRIDDAPSDAEFILEELRAKGYSAISVTFNAANYGAWCNRTRIYFLAYEGYTRLNDRRLQQAREFLECMEVGPGVAADVILEVDELAEYLPDAERRKKKPREDSRDQYKSEHMDIFASCSLEWPPKMNEDDGAIDYTGMTLRMKEVTWFLHQNFAHAPKHLGEWEAVDVNENLKRLLVFPPADGEPLKNPWRFPLCGTITGNSKWLVRRVQPDGSTIVRLLSGVECMRAMGWDLLDWADDTAPGIDPCLNDELLKNMAGNAFSGYAFGPVVAVGLACRAMQFDVGDVVDLEADEQVASQGASSLASSDIFGELS